jgi:hypothetical protein
MVWDHRRLLCASEHVPLYPGVVWAQIIYGNVYIVILTIRKTVMEICDQNISTIKTVFKSLSQVYLYIKFKKMFGTLRASFTRLRGCCDDKMFL